jgi:tetratricopeptide (TPR) repeat protein
LQHVDETVAHVTFGRGGNADSLIGIGWSPAEAGFRWMIDDVSEFWLDGRDFGACLLALDLHPNVGLPARPAQRVVIKVEGHEVYRAELSGPTRCDVPLPPMAPPATGRIRVTIEHPDAIRPMDLARGHNDQRRLAFAIREARLHRLNVSDRKHDATPAEDLSAPAVIVEPARLSTVFVGNCQMGALCSLYRRLLPSDSDHDVTYIASYQDATEEARQTVAQATAVVQQVLNFAPRIGDLATKAKVYLVPHASAAFLWPFAGSPHPLNRPEPTIEQSGPYNGELGDIFLNRMIAAGASQASAVADYLGADASTVARAERMMELHLENQRQRDAACDIQIADRIEAQLQTTRLFRSPNHPEPIMACWMAEELFARMGEHPAAISRLMAGQPDALPATETPIHPAVVRHFGLTYAAPDRRYRYFDEGGFTFVEYVGRYMRYEWNALLAEGLSLLRQKQTDLAVAKLEKALPTAPRSATARMALVETLARLGRLKDAIEYACQAVEIEPENGAYIKRLWQLSDSLRLEAPKSVVAGPSCGQTYI